MNVRDIAIGAGLLWWLFRKRDESPSVPGLDPECWTQMPEGCWSILPCAPGGVPVSAAGPPGNVCGAAPPPETPVTPPAPGPSAPSGGGGFIWGPFGQGGQGRQGCWHPHQWWHGLRCLRWDDGVPCNSYPAALRDPTNPAPRYQGLPICPGQRVPVQAAGSGIEGYFSAAPGPGVLSMGFPAGRRR